jgi:hypothetical protein
LDLLNQLEAHHEQKENAKREGERDQAIVLDDFIEAIVP